MTAPCRASIAGLALLVAGCVGPQRPSDVVVYASGTDLESANPLVTIHPLSRQVQRHVLFVTLARYDSALRPQPYFARSWSWSPDRRTLSLALEPTLRWHDGVRTTAHDVVFTVALGRDPRSGFSRASDLAVMDSIVATSDTSVAITFGLPQRELPAILSELPIVPRHRLGAVAPADLRRAAYNLDPIGNGPFRFMSRVAGQRWTFGRNESFPLAMGGPPRIRQLVVAVVDEPTTKFAGLAAGDLDFAGIGPTMAALADRDPLIDVVNYPVLFATALIFNSQRPPFDDARVRRAVNVSIDRERIISAALAGYAVPASGPVTPENPLALPGAPVHDPVTADSLLDAAGWRRGAGGWRARSGPFSVELLTVGSGDNAVEQLVQADLAARGIRVEIRQMELMTFLERVRSTQKSFDMVVTGIPGDLSLAYVRAMFESAQRGSSLDYADFHAPALDALFARARQARTAEELASAWHAVQQEVAHHVPAAWLYHSRGLQGVSSRMRGVRMDLRGEMATVAQWTVDTAAQRDAGAGR